MADAAPPSTIVGDWQPSLFAAATGYEVTPIHSRDAYGLILRRHYARRIPSISYAFGLMLDGDLVGVCTYGTTCLLYTSPSPRDLSTSRMPSSA